MGPVVTVLYYKFVLWIKLAHGSDRTFQVKNCSDIRDVFHVLLMMSESAVWNLRDPGI